MDGSAMGDKISIVIPVKNSKQTIGECIESAKSSGSNNIEIVVVDDNSSDGSIDIAKGYGCKVVKSEGMGGVAAARNAGAKKAKGEIILFMDSDIILRKNAFELIREDFEKKDVEAVIGIQSKELRFLNFFSQYKNLWMRYTYLKLPDFVSLFYTSIASIKKDAFLKTGGFDPKYRIPDVEDTEFGQRLRDLGFRVYLDKNLEVEHLKYYNLISILKTDFYRSSGLIKMVLRRGIEKFLSRNETSVPSSFMAQLPFSLSFSVFLLYFLISGNILAGLISMVSVLIFLILNWDFFSFLKREKGISFTVKSGVFLFVDAFWILGGMVYGIITYYIFGKKYY